MKHIASVSSITVGWLRLSLRIFRNALRPIRWTRSVVELKTASTHCRTPTISNDIIAFWLPSFSIEER